MGCINCGDNSGWSVFHTWDAEEGTPQLLWAACADCNDDGLKPKPRVCDFCGQTEPFCLCEREGVA